MDDLPPGPRAGTPGEPGPAPTRTLPPLPPQPERRRFTERPWSFSVVLAVALLSLVIGGLLGAGLANVAADGHDGAHDRGRHGPGHHRLDRDDHLRPPGMMDGRRFDRPRPSTTPRATPSATP